MGVGDGLGVDLRSDTALNESTKLIPVTSCVQSTDKDFSSCAMIDDASAGHRLLRNANDHASHYCLALTMNDVPNSNLSLTPSAMHSSSARLDFAL